MKKVDGEEHPASDFAYVPDPEKPSTWKLPIFNMHHVGGALAAMTSDYRGNPVEIPEGDRHAVMKKSWPGKRSWNRKKADSGFLHSFFLPPGNKPGRMAFSPGSLDSLPSGRVKPAGLFCSAACCAPREAPQLFPPLIKEADLHLFSPLYPCNGMAFHRRL
ncbi:hypothetical protein ABFY27_16700 [Akkermansia massiliensis]